MAEANAINSTSAGIVTNTGTGFTSSTVTQHGILIGGASNAASSLGVAATGTVLSGNTGADPSFTATPTVTSITFGSGTALSIYQTGTWTPGISFNGLSTGITYGAQNGFYCQIGEIVFINATIVLTNKGSATGSAFISGLPVLPGANGGNNFINIGFSSLTLTASYTSAYGQFQAANANLNINQIGSGQSYTNVTDTSFANNTQIYLSGFYLTN